VRTFTERVEHDDFFEGEHIVDCDFAGAVWTKVDFDGCHFQNVRLARARFERCSFEGCSFEDCDLSMVVLDSCSFRDVTFLRAKLMGIDWSQSALSFSAAFEECTLDYGNFGGMNLRNHALIGCSAKDTVFQRTDLQHADFSGTDLSGAQFGRTNLNGADLSSASHYRIDPHSNQVRRTRFSIAAAVAYLDSLGIEVVP
jgi:fluoroquinolone resistance protein